MRDESATVPVRSTGHSVCYLGFPLASFYCRSLKRARDGWRTNKKKMILKILVSFLIGQAFFWHFGYDQIGLFSNTKIQLGYGQTVAKTVYRHIPHDSEMAWAVKVTEIAADTGKIPIEGYAYLHYGIVPDAVADSCTQPVYSTGEVAEKITGAITLPGKVPRKQSVLISLGCIYGSLFRYSEVLVMWLIDKLLGSFFKKQKAAGRGLGVVREIAPYP